MRSPFTLVSGSARLVGDAAGSGPCAIMLHAGVADRRMWRSTMDHLAQRCLAVAYDRRGFGETVSPDEPFRHIDDLDRVIDRFTDGSVHLVGCSQGGRVAIDYALAHQTRVASLVLVAPAVSGASTPPGFPPAIAALLAELDAAEAMEDLDRVNAIEARLWLDGPLAPEGRVQGGARDLFLDMNAKALAHPPLTRETPCADATGALSSIGVPALVVWGPLDFPHIQERSRGLAQALPAGRPMVMEGCAHLPMLEQPSAFNLALGAFFER